MSSWKPFGGLNRCPLYSFVLQLLEYLPYVENPIASSINLFPPSCNFEVEQVCICCCIYHWNTDMYTL